MAASTNVVPQSGDPASAEIASLPATVDVDRQPNVVASGPSIVVLNDLWRYVPAYFQTVDAVSQPRSEAGRRLLERRRRQMARQQQQQQQQQRDLTATGVGENQRGTLSVDELLAYITNSSTVKSSTTCSMPESRVTSHKGGRKKKQSSPNADAVVADSSLPNDAIDANETRENGPGKKELQPDNVTVSDTADIDSADFVVIRRGRKHRPTASEKSNMQLHSDVLLGGRRKNKPTFCDALDEFSLSDKKAVPRGACNGDGDIAASVVISDRSAPAATISTSTKLSQTLPLSTSVARPSVVSSHATHVPISASSSESILPVTVQYNDVVKGNRHRRQQKPAVVVVSTDSSTNYRYQQEQPCSTPDIELVKISESATPTNGSDATALTTDVETSLNCDSSSQISKQMAFGRAVRTVSCSTQTSSVEMSQCSTSSPSSNSAAGNGDSVRRPNSIVFLDEKRSGAVEKEAIREDSGLSFGSVSDITTSQDSGSDKVAMRSDTVDKEYLDAATSPIQSPPTSSRSTPETGLQLSTASSHCRRITPLCRMTGSTSSATGTPVGIVPPIMHVETASGDATLSTAANSILQEVSCKYTFGVNRLLQPARISLC